MSKKRILITNIHSELSQQLIEQLRDDHSTFESGISMVGVSRGNGKQSDPSKPLTIIDFDEDPNRVIRAALESDVLVLDLVGDAGTAEIVVGFMGEGGNTQKVVAVSTYMTWAGQVLEEGVVGVGEEGDPVAALVIGRNIQNIEPERKVKRDSEVRIRKTPPKWRNTRVLEEKVMRLNELQGKQACVINSGLPYGQAFTQLQWYFEQALVEHKPIPCFGTGDNIIPMIHISDLAKCVALLVNSQVTQSCYLAVDDSTPTQLELVTQFGKQLGQTVITQPLEYVSETQQKMSVNLQLLRSKQFDSIDWFCKQGILARPTLIMEEFFNYRDFEFKKIILIQERRSGYEGTLRDLCKQHTVLLINREFISNWLDTEGSAINEQISRMVQTEKHAFEQLLIKNQQAQKKKKPGKTQNKLKSSNSIPLEFSYSNELIRMAVDIVVSSIKNKAILVDLQGVQNLPVLSDFDPMSLDQAEDTLNPTSTSQKQPKSRVVIVAEATRRCSYGEISIQQDIDEVMSREDSCCDDLGAQSMNKLGHGSKRSLAEEDRANRNLNCRQYLMDLVMPAVSHALSEIEITRPKDMLLALIKLLREQAQAEDCIYA